MQLNSVNERIQALRQEMSANGIQACLIPSADPHQSEYVAPHWMCRTWISGFTGSAGLAIVTADHAGLWTDSRYFIQAEAELANSEMELHRQIVPGKPEHEDWLLENLSEGDQLAVDGRLLSVEAHARLSKRLREKGIELVTDRDFVGAVWADRPDLPGQPIWQHDLIYTGLSRLEKIALLRERMANEGIGLSLLTALADIAWLFNLRGSDVDFNPVFYAYAVVTRSNALLFVNRRQLPVELAGALEANGITIMPYDQIFPYLRATDPVSKIRLAASGTSIALHQEIPHNNISTGRSFVADMKGRKNEVELNHVRGVMEKDGVALVKLFIWLEKELGSGKVTEYAVSEKLIALRKENDSYRGESFPAIAGYAGNGAIVHYRPTEADSATLQAEGLFLLDCGGQYLDGTTDITRTIALGPPTAAQRAHYTLVLKGHIDLAMARFPQGTAGHQLDALARMPLWRAGLNYGHGTGHGVGFFLNVHEGPQGIHPRAKGTGAVPFQAGMITSNEPGYYLEGAYGIRIENLVLTVPMDAGSEGNYLQFETLSLFPMEWDLIETGMLTTMEREWLEVYHAEVFRRLSPHLEREEVEWLRLKCFG